jgi:hypothetical protein
MGRRRAVMTGAAAAALIGLEGFNNPREFDRWAALDLWAGPATMRAAPHLVRTRRWLEPVNIERERPIEPGSDRVVSGGIGVEPEGERPIKPGSDRVVSGGIGVEPEGERPIRPELVAHPAIILRHLGLQIDALHGRRMTGIERIELALEHAFREGFVSIDDLHLGGGADTGLCVIRQLLHLRRDEPPTESYAETRGLQLIRRAGVECHRQVWVRAPYREAFRVDFVLLRRRRNVRRPRPKEWIPGLGLVLEINGKQWHEGTFERDHHRQVTFAALGIPWLGVTPNQIENQPQLVLNAIRQLMHRLG